ncbi:MAG: hypothetical protein HY270_10075 [Deltaproteobacteria bacterium]|nr:hypothetical protein [Deltaproteobacteria bacterium]
MKRFGYLVFVPISMTLFVATHAFAVPPPETSLNTCQDKVRTEGKTAVKNTVTAVGNCLKKVAADVLKNNVAITAATSQACVNEFRKLNDTRVPPADKSIEEKFRENVDKKCVPLFTPSQTHTFADIMGAGGGTLEDIKTTNIDLWCKHFGGDGSIGSVTEWEDCMVASHNCEAAAAIAAQYPRASEWVASLLGLGNMPAVAPPGSDPSKTTDAVSGATSFLSVLDPDGDGINSPRCGGEGVACTTSCCYVENTFPNSPETSCIEYTGPGGPMATFTGLCGFTTSIPSAGGPGSQVHTPIPGPCGAGPSPVNGNPCFIGFNGMLAPTDSSCP